MLHSSYLDIHYNVQLLLARSSVVIAVSNAGTDPVTNEPHEYNPGGQHHEIGKHHHYYELYYIRWPRGAAHSTFTSSKNGRFLQWLFPIMSISHYRNFSIQVFLSNSGKS